MSAPVGPDAAASPARSASGQAGPARRDEICADAPEQSRLSDVLASVEARLAEPAKEQSVMKKILLGALCAAAALTAVSSANASGGCGPAYHRGPYGGCRLNRGAYMGGPVVGVRVGGPAVAVAIGAPGIGVFYPGRGYWDGRRYWARREAWNGGWRYR